jgi:SAM-dependent methyltransferase
MTEKINKADEYAAQRYKRVRVSYQSTSLAGAYDDQRFNRGGRLFLNRRMLMALTGVLNAAKIYGHPINHLLDLPCGTGRLFPTLLAKGVKVVGSDISLEMMQNSRNKLPNQQPVPLVQCDATRMPFKTGSFDAVTVIRFLTMKVPLQVQRAIFKEIGRVSCAWVIIECRYEKGGSFIVNWIREKVFLQKPLVNYFLRDEIKRELKAAGINLVRIFNPFGMFLFSNKWLLLGRVERKAPEQLPT